jgi:hypothetical protein
MLRWAGELWSFAAALVLGMLAKDLVLLLLLLLLV